MSYNPYTDQFARLQQELAAAKARKLEHEALLRWYRSFDLDRATRELHATDRTLRSLQEKKAFRDRAYEAEVARAAWLEPEAAVGLDPRRWFSAERRARAAELNACRRSQKDLVAQVAETDDQIKSTVGQLRRRQNEIDRYRTFNPLEAQAALKALEPQIESMQPELARLRRLREDLDRRLEVPMRELAGKQGEAGRLRRDIEAAQDLKRGLEKASSRSERRTIHEECEDEFGEGNPKLVIERKQRQLAGVERAISKLEERIRVISERAVRKVGLVVIDGNNLCHEGDSFVGLRALQALAAKLSGKYKVLIVFDASAEHLLQMSAREIAAQFGDGTRVHVVAAGQQADETLLEAATAADAFVISNDRFLDFPEKPVVRERRLFRHEILNGWIYVHDLEVAAAFI